jgi:hypothetical protein
MGRFGAHGAWYRLAHADYPQAWREGPLLSQAVYPDVLVALAVSDGAALDIELVPTRAGRHRLGFSRLCPGRTYRLDGVDCALLQADLRGDAQAEVILERRTSLRLLPSE